MLFTENLLWCACVTRHEAFEDGLLAPQGTRHIPESNSILKLVFGTRRTRLTANNAANEIIVRTSPMGAEQLVHNAVQKWADACERRSVCRKDASSADRAESSSGCLSDYSTSITSTSSRSGTASTQHSASSMSLDS